jgi:hypothetical protein
VSVDPEDTIVIFIVNTKSSLPTKKQFIFTFLIDSNNRLRSGEKLGIWTIIPLPSNSIGAELVTLLQRPSSNLTSIQPYLKADLARLINWEEPEAKTEYNTAPNSPQWSVSDFDHLPENWGGYTIEERFDQIDHYNELIQEELEAADWFKENAYWYNEDFLESHDRSP